MPIPELRVHGVSGTPPRDMLYTDPVESIAGRGHPVQSQRHVKVHRQSTVRDFGVNRQVRAFHWGGLTSGSWLTALWVFLLPFSMANIAGWTTRHRSRNSNTTVRLFGLVLTAVFLNMVLTVSIDFYWQWAEIPNRLVAAVVFLALGWLWWGLVSWASTRSHFSNVDGATRRRYLWWLDPETMIPEGGPQGDEAWKDPTDRPIVDRELWQVHPILHRLRRIHFGFGYLVLALAAATGSDTGWEIPNWSHFDIPTAAVSVLMLLPFLALSMTGREGVTPLWARHLTAWLPAVGALALVGASALVAFAGVETAESGHWAHLRDTSVVILALAIVALAAVAITSGAISATALTLGTFFGVVMGAGAATAIDRYVGEDATKITGLDWLAISTLVWLLVVTAVAIFVVGRRLDNADPDLWRALHDTTGSLGSLFIWIPTTGLIAAVFTLGARCASSKDAGNLIQACFQSGRLGSPPPWAQWAGVFAVGLVWLALVYLLVRSKKNYPAVLLALVVPAAVVIWRGRLIPGTDFALSLDNVVVVARLVAIVIPAGFFFGRVVAGLRGGTESRRGIGVIWDVVMFWPRWFHPLAPPAYGPHAVKRLRDEVSRRLVPDDGINTRPLILAAHSQGAILATVAIATMAEAHLQGNRFVLDKSHALERLGLLTYGCPLVHLYDNYFPSARFEELAECIATQLGAGAKPPPRGRWANLVRPTDPIGGPVLDGIDLFIDDPVNQRLPFDKKADDSVSSTFQRWWWNKIRRKAGPLPPKPIYRGHSNYEPTREFLDQRDRISSLL